MKDLPLNYLIFRRLLAFAPDVETDTCRSDGSSDDTTGTEEPTAAPALAVLDVLVPTTGSSSSEDV